MDTSVAVSKTPHALEVSRVSVQTSLDCLIDASFDFAFVLLLVINTFDSSSSSSESTS